MAIAQVLGSNVQRHDCGPESRAASRIIQGLRLRGHRLPSGSQGRIAHRQGTRGGPAAQSGAGADSLQRTDEDDDEASTPEGRTRQALRLAQQALAEAQEVSENLHKLPSAQQSWKVPGRVLAVLKPVLYAAAAAGIWASHAVGLKAQVPTALLVGTVIGLRGLRRRSLNKSGALAAVLVGTATLGASLRCGATLLSFFLASSALTRYAEDRKDLDEEFKPGGQRDWMQVFCNALIPSGIAVLLASHTGGTDMLLGAQSMRAATQYLGAFLGYFAACCGDTWSSEVGQLSAIQPRLITTLRPVRPGTNGGVTPLGVAAGLAGGLFVGVVFFLGGLLSPSSVLHGGSAAWHAAAAQWPIIPLGLAIGLVGSLIDSVLGATVQFTGFNRQTGKLTSKYSSSVVPISGIPLLSNNAVNLVSATLCAWLGSRTALGIFPA